MSNITRRRLLQAGLGLGLAPLVSGTLAGTARLASAESFAQGRMKGFSIGGALKNDMAYFYAFAETGANTGRILFPFQKCNNCDRFGRSPNDVTALTRVLHWVRDRGIRLVILGDFAGVDQPEFWKNTALRDSFVENWRWFAKTFGNDPAIAGLDLLNEPNPPSLNGSVTEANASWQPLAEKAIEAIRNEGVTLPIIYECVGGGGSMGLRDMQPLKDPQVVYSIHNYTPHEITHQHVHPNWSQTLPYPAGIEWQLGGWDRELGVTVYDRKRLENDLRHTIAFQRRYKVPIYVGEFSCVRWAPNGSRERYIADCLDIYRKFGWSWTYHEFRGWPGWDAEIDSENPAVITRTQNAPVMNMLRAEMNRSTVSD